MHAAERIQGADQVMAAPIAEVPASAVGLRDKLSVLRTIKLGIFHIGSSMADILASGVWNRVMIKELGFAATPIALLLALRYFLAPFSIWVGQRSDKVPWRGYHRLPYIWGGRLAMVLSYVLLGASTLALAGNYDSKLLPFSFGLVNVHLVDPTASLLGWLGVVASLIMFSIGSTFSGTTYLSLLYDVSPKQHRTRTVSIAWFFLILGFAVSGIIYSRLLPEYSRDAFLSLFLIAPLLMGALWFFSLLGEEKPHTARTGANPETAPTRSFWHEMRGIWASQHTRMFFLFLALSNLFFYMQDVILEPFAAEVFKMPLATTNRFSSYWGSMTLIGIIVSLMLSRRFPKTVNNNSLSVWGVTTLLITFIIFTVCAVFQVRPLVTIGLVVMGVGLGMWTVGSLGLMMDMTRAWGAGLYLALWTVASTLARGAGVTSGGIVLDTALAFTGGRQAFSYGIVFVLQVAGFAVALWTLSRVNVRAFEQEAPRTEAVITASMD